MPLHILHGSLEMLRADYKAGRINSDMLTAGRNNLIAFVHERFGFAAANEFAGRLDLENP